MKTSSTLPVLLAIVAAYSEPLAAQSLTDLLLQRYGQFEMGRQGPKVIVGRAATKAYHVCMDNGQYALPLKVSHDGKETIVNPGECQLIEASRIKLATLGKLDAGATLIGTRKNVERTEDLKQYTTEVQVARESAAPAPGAAQLVSDAR